MTNQQRKKLGCWWFLIPFALLLVAFLLQLLGPQPRIRVGKETTYIESHLGEDGLPDYVAYLHDQSNPGISPDENAAALYWKALWPGEMADNEVHQQLVCDALGIPVPSELDAIKPLYDSTEADLAEWIEANVMPSEAEGDMESRMEKAGTIAFDVLGKSMDVPWTRQDIPILAAWVDDNQQPIDWLVEGSERPKYYNPSPSMLDGSDQGVLSFLLPGVQMLRDGARALKCRAMLRLGEGKVDEAWRDIKACHCLARHVSQGQTIISRLVGIAIDGMASAGTQAILHHGNPSEAQAQRIFDDLNAMPPLPGMADAIAGGERIVFLDSVKRLADGSVTVEEFGGLEADGAVALLSQGNLRVNLNIVMQRGNEWYDRLAAASELPRVERLLEAERLDAELVALSPQATPGLLAKSFVSPDARSEVVANLMLNLFLPSMNNANEAADRNQAIGDMNRVAAGLALFRARNGNYPDKLEELVPEVWEQLPRDIFSGKSFVYVRKDGGYCLYSVFRNGVDDGGRDFSGSIIDCEWVSPSESSDMENSDLVLLMPLREFDILSEE